MPGYFRYPTPHLLGRVAYPANTRLRPDGDTVHLLNPVLLVDGRAIKPVNGKFTVWVTGASRPKTITLQGGKTGVPHVAIRFEGLDAPEEHYRATPFELEIHGQKRRFALDTAVPHDERSGAQWSPATQYALRVLTAAGWALIALDREVTDKYRRVLGYVYASDARGKRGTFITLELLKRGLAFPFLFESSQERIPAFLAAARQARRRGLGVWKRYQHHALLFSSTWPAPRKYTDPEPANQLRGPLCLPVAFRRAVDVRQLKGLSLKTALQKYDAMRYSTGDVLSGDRYGEIPVDDLIWAPHRFT
jgi:endonuclease YncB( thermonuclease family)